MRRSLHIGLIFSLIFHFNIYYSKAGDTILNKYAEVIKIFNYTSSDVDSVLVDTGSFFKPHDTVIIYQAKGVDWEYADSIANRSGFNYAGKFEYQLVDTVKGDTVIFKSFLSQNKPSIYNASCAVQLIKVPTFKNLKTTQTISAPGWNGKKGGFLAIIADTITLQANIDVSGKGFLGADPTHDTSAICASKADSLAFKTGNFGINAQDSGGLKGEGVVVFNSFYRRGEMPIYNGGGGGNGYHSGGGGGGNWGYGGNGGYQANTCSFILKSTGGNSLYSMVQVDNQFIGNSGNYRAVFGGGGGASNQKKSYIATKGGNGGGIVIIMADVFKGNGKQIIANGQTVTDIATAGGGGGGGGGCIMLDVNQYQGSLTLYLKGGNGGNTQNINGGGPGGGGGGGYVCHNGNSLSSAVLISLVGGANGVGYWGAMNSSSGGYQYITQGNLILPTNAFLFNIMPGNQEICSDKQADSLVASKPKGGNGVYSFNWFESTNLKTWTIASGQAHRQNYQPPFLSDTTFFRRIVMSRNENDTSIVIADTSTVVTINVLPAITNNSISILGQDTICSGLLFPKLKGTNATGGDGVHYAYQWQDSVFSWKDTLGIYDTLQPVQNFTTKFRRIVTSGVCINTSNEEKITVLPLINNNLIGETQWVSKGDTAHYLRSIQSLIGGNGTYSYLWQQSANMLSWNSAAFINSKSFYIVPLLSDTLYYRRLVFSGENNTCNSTSNILTISVLDSIQNNHITGSDTICGKTSPNNFIGSEPKGGDPKTGYRYQWEKSPDKVSWDSITTISGDTIYNPGIINSGDSIHITSFVYFRRIVRSGHLDCCKDTSNSIQITVLPYIKNNLIINTDSAICHAQIVDSIHAAEPKDGDGPYSYAWQISFNSLKWNTAQGDTNHQNYYCDTLLSTKYFRREVISGLCKSYSDTLKITVLPLIDNNIINSDLYVCKGSLPDSLHGSLPTGGDGMYKYNWQDSVLTWQTAPGISSDISYQPDTTSVKLYFRRIVKSGLHGCCIDTSKVFMISIHELPTLALKGFNDSICLGSGYPLHLSITGQKPFNIIYTNGVNISDTSIIDSILTVKPSFNSNNYTYDTFTYRIISLKDGYNCNAKQITGTGTLSVFKVPKANAGDSIEVCGLKATLDAKPSVGKGIWSSISPVTFNDSSQSTTIVQVPPYDIYKNYNFTWSEKNGVCSSSDNVEVIFYQQPDTVFAGQDQNEPFLFSSILKALSPEIGHGKWTALNGQPTISNDTSFETQVSNLQLGKNYFLWTVTNGVCPSISDTVLINAADIRIPQGFSPNGDSINDFFEIIGLNRVTGAHLIVFNKWGKEVYKSDNYYKEWNGTENGSPLPEDAYFYVLNVIGRTYKGIVYIKR